MFTKYGYSIIGFVAILSFIMIVISIFSQNIYIKYSVVTIALIILLFTLNFFRDPERVIPNRDDIIVSPADGKILIVKEVFEKRFLNDNAIQISIFMSPLNVHVNRIPIDGKIDYLNYVKGEYLIAFHDKADERNERSEIGIKSKFVKVLFTQVAGMVARRIVYELNLGDMVKMGNRFGMIKFGSRVDVIVEKGWKINVKEGDLTKAGETILFVR